MKARQFFVLLLFLVGCDQGVPPEPSNLENLPTFTVMQHVVFDRQCATAGCHNSTSRAGGLSLAADESFGNLVDIDPSNTMAKNDGLKRIKPGDPMRSFLFHKIDQPIRAGYGERMPFGSNQLPSQYREFVRQWIAGGAPQDGIVADVRLLKDPIVSQDDFTPLTPPGQGIQLHLRPFAIDPGKEREIFVYGKINTSDTLYVTRVEIKMRGGSHHFILYKYFGNDLVEGQQRDLYSAINEELFRSGREYMIGAQTPYLAYDLPAGVAMPLAPDQGFDLNSHYVNKGSDIISGEVFVNLFTAPKIDTLRIAKPIFNNFIGFTLPARQKTTITRTTIYNRSIKIFSLSSHTHKRGESFKIFLVGGSYDGTLVYENHSWDHPPNVTFPSAAFPRLIEIEPGWGYRIEVVYNNETERIIRFGLTSEDEMCIVLGYYYE